MVISKEGECGVLGKGKKETSICRANVLGFASHAWSMGYSCVMWCTSDVSFIFIVGWVFWVSGMGRKLERMSVRKG